MVVKTVVDIELNDERFKAFAGLFNKFKGQLEKLPGAWGDVNKEIGLGNKGFMAMTAAMMAQNELLLKQLKAEKDATREVRQQATVWESMSRSTRNVAGNIANATTSLLKWTALTSVFTGLLGAGGLFGIDRLAAGVASGRRSSLGTGISYGQGKAFGLNFGRFVDSDSYLSSINESLHDASKRGSLYNAGLTEADLASGNASQVGSTLLTRLKRLADGTPDAQLGNLVSSRGLGALGIDTQTLQRLKATSAEEIATQQRRNRTDSGTMNLDAKAQRGWADLDTQLERASLNISNVFGRGLAALGPGISAFSESITKSISTFVENGKFKEWVESIGSGLEKFAKYVGTDDFQNSVKNFSEGIIWAGNKIVSAARFLGFKPSAGISNTPVGGAIHGPLPAPAPGTWMGTERGGYSGSDPAVKPGAGILAPGLAQLAGDLQKNINGLGIVTAAQDKFHIGHKSAHNDGRGLDFRVSDPSRSAEVAEAVRSYLRTRGIAGTVLDEYKNPSKDSTGGHIHVQTAVKLEVSNKTGSDVIAQANQVTK